jgi:hypothetical protein
MGVGGSIFPKSNTESFDLELYEDEGLDRQ